LGTKHKEKKTKKKGEKKLVRRENYVFGPCPFPHNLLIFKMGGEELATAFAAEKGH